MRLRWPSVKKKVAPRSTSPSRPDLVRRAGERCAERWRDRCRSRETRPPRGVAGTRRRACPRTPCRTRPRRRERSTRACPSFDVRPTSMCAWGCWLVNFQALPRRFSMTAASKLGVALDHQPPARRSRRRARVGFAKARRRSARATLRQVHALSTQLGAAHAREREQIVDRACAMRCAAARTRARLLVPLRVELVAVVLEDGLTEAVDAAQRRAQIVGYGVAEGFELAVRGIGLRVRAPESFLRVLHGVDVRAGAEPARDVPRLIADRQRAPEKPVIDSRLLSQAVLNLVGVARRGWPSASAPGTRSGRRGGRRRSSSRRR